MGLQGSQGYMAVMNLDISYANLRAFSHKCWLYSLGPKFPLWNQEYLAISAIWSHSNILWFYGAGHVHFLSNAVSSEPGLRLYYQAVRQRETSKLKATWSLLLAGGGVREGERDWLGARPRQMKSWLFPFLSTETSRESLNFCEPLPPQLNFSSIFDCTGSLLLRVGFLSFPRAGATL